MIRFLAAMAVALASCRCVGAAQRIVIIKVDGLNADLLYRTMAQTDPATGRSVLPWMEYIFREHGTVFENFYTRGISLSAPSWSMLDTGHHTVIRGNAEFDRYTGEVYDYLNFFPFYIQYARMQQEDMPGVEVLDRAGIPLIIDAYPYEQVYQSFQLYQRGVNFATLTNVLKRRFSSQVLLSAVESAETPSLSDLWQHETEAQIQRGLEGKTDRYLDLYTGDADHEGHATSRPESLLAVLKHLDQVVGNIWNEIQASPMANETTLAVVSDHGMNNTPGVISEAFSLPDLFNSPQGGAHHVLTNRHQLEKFKLRGLDPLVHRVITPSTASSYLAGQASSYPTAWLDLDGNERAAVQLRNSDINRIHILLLQLARTDLDPALRAAAVADLKATIDRHRADWICKLDQLDEELRALAVDIASRKQLVAEERPRKVWKQEQKGLGKDKAARRLAEQLANWEREKSSYESYSRHMRALLALQPSTEHPMREHISDLIPEMSLGETNTVAQLQNYIAGPMPGGLVLDRNGRLDEAKSFRHVNYFTDLSLQVVRNNPQPQLSSYPVDFLVRRLPNGAFPDAANSYWIYKDERRQLVLLQRADGQLSLRPISYLKESADNRIDWKPAEWRAGLPLELFEDDQLQVPQGSDRAAWLAGWHSERDWFDAIHGCKYSNGVIGITEQFSPVAPNVPGVAGESALRIRYEKRRRELVEPDFQVFAADHWNFNVRDVNPGGNHGSFFRISTHSVWMMSGAGVATRSVTTPYDSLNFASTVLQVEGKTAPMPDRVVPLQ